MTDVVIPEPCDSYELLGCEGAERAFLAALERGRIHHAWLLAGPRGVGKATFAFRAARRLLGAAPAASLGLLGASPEDPVCRRIVAGSHADLTVISRPYDEKRGRYKGEITVDEARKLAEAFTATAGEGGWRVAIIDAADDLNVNATNAILKTLEEPPPRAVVFLVCHAPGRLPATVRSRCRRLVFAPPGEPIAAEVTKSLLGCSDEAAAAAAKLAQGRPGEAVRLAAAGGADLALRLDRLFRSLPRLDAEEAHALADKLGGGFSDQARQEAEELRPYFFEALSAHALAQTRAGGSAEAWGEAWDQVVELSRDLDELNLDGRLVVLEALGAAQRAAGAR
jgi:DNA polymerase-3 subunit delta'